MNYHDYKEAFGRLRWAGLTIREIGRLTRLRRKFAASELDQAPVQQYHLEFVRWLVMTHRLTDQLEAHYNTVSGKEVPEFPESER